MEKQRTVRERAIDFLHDVDSGQREKMKQMLRHGVAVGRGAAEIYGISPDIFSGTLKNILFENKGGINNG